MGSTIPEAPGVVRKLRVPALLVLCLLLGACSSTTNFFYNRLHIVLPWYLERYVDLDRSQAEAFDVQLGALLDWHRREELPRYVALLDDALARLDGSVSEGDVIAVTASAEEAWYRLRDRALDELLFLGASLSDAQIEEFLESLEKRQVKYERKYLPRDEEEFREDSAESLRDSLQDYLGRLSGGQRAIVDDAAASLQRSDALWLAERRRWMDMLGRELAREPGWQVRIREQVHNWEETLDAPTSEAYEHNTRTVQRAIAAVVEARSARQDERLRRKLGDLRDDLWELHEEAEPRGDCPTPSPTVTC